MEKIFRGKVAVPKELNENDKTRAEKNADGNEKKIFSKQKI